MATEELQLKGIGAETLLRTLAPWLERRLEWVLSQLEQCDAKLETFLDLRAELKILRQLERDMLQHVKRSKPSV